MEPLPLQTPGDRSTIGRDASVAAKLIAWLNVAGTFLALILIFAFFAAQAPSFRTFSTVETLARQITIVSLAAMGMTIIMIGGGIDLSVGSQIALTTVVIARLLNAGWNPWLAALGGVGAGATCGLVNGLLITGLRIVPFIITLGTLGVFRGVAKILAHERTINVEMNALQTLIQKLDEKYAWMLFPPGVWMMLLLVAATSVLLRFTTFGRHVVAVGSNEQTARLCGVRVHRVKILLYTLGGMFAGIAGVIQFSRLTLGDPTAAVGLELSVIAAVVIGGGSLAGGEGSPLGSLIGAAIMMTISAGGSHLGWRNPVQEIITGVIIILAVAIDRLRRRMETGS